MERGFLQGSQQDTSHQNKKHTKHPNYNFTVSNEDLQSVPQTIKHTCNVAHLKSCDDVRQNRVVLESNISQCVQSHIRTSQSITVILHNMTPYNELALTVQYVNCAGIH